MHGKQFNVDEASACINGVLCMYVSAFFETLNFRCLVRRETELENSLETKARNLEERNSR